MGESAPGPSSQKSHLTRRAGDGEGTREPRADLERQFAAVYDQLRRIAHRRLQAEARGHTLNTTALVHEAFLRMSAERSEAFADRPQFFALAARAMRRILVDYARRTRSQKRAGGRAVSVSALDRSSDSLDLSPASAHLRDAGLLTGIDEALKDLEAIDPRLARVVEYRFFVGLTESETAELLGVTPRTVTRDWVRARGWLRTRLDPNDADGA